MAYRCTGSYTRKYSAERTEGELTTGKCMDCPHRIPLIPSPGKMRAWLVVALHLEDGTLVEDAIHRALEATVGPETAARHLAQIREAVAKKPLDPAP